MAGDAHVLMEEELMRHFTRRGAAALCLVSLASLSGVCPAGPLNPPAGPVASTYKTLREVEPRTPVQSLPGSATALHVITQPGSYYLTGNIAGVPGKHGIEVRSDDVTLDLGGFALTGAAGSLNGVDVPNVRKNLDIRNGTVRGWGGDGIDAANALNSIVSFIRAFDNGAAGVFVGVGGMIRDCVARDNGTDGVIALDGATLVACTATGNTGTGIRVTNGCTISQCTGMGNTGNGFVGIFGNSYHACSAKANGVDGFAVNDGNTIDTCTVKENGQDGIQVSRGNVVTNNSSTVNAFTGPGAGIRALSIENRIEANNLIENTWGLRIESPGNLIIRNSASRNTTNYSIVPGNRNAQIIAPGEDFVSTDPCANFVF